MVFKRDMLQVNPIIVVGGEQLENTLQYYVADNTSAVCCVDDGRINFSDFCKLMKQQHETPSDEARLPEHDTRQVFRVRLQLYFLCSSIFVSCNNSWLV